MDKLLFVNRLELMVLNNINMEAKTTLNFFIN